MIIYQEGGSLKLIKHQQTFSVLTTVLLEEDADFLSGVCFFVFFVEDVSEIYLAKNR